MSTKWSNKEIIHFLEIYERYEVLWNSFSDRYRDRHARDSAFESILKDLNNESLTRETLRTKIKMIRTVYSQELGKIVKSLKSGAVGDDVYKPRLLWFEKADFLRAVTSSRASNSIMELDMQEEYIEEESEDNYFPEDKISTRHSNDIKPELTYQPVAKPVRNARWSNEDIMLFLELYEKYDVLWNIYLDNYRDRNARNIAFENILKELNIDNLTVDILRTKVKMIKTIYSQELAKITKSIKNGATGDEIYKPKLQWFEKAGFLRSVTSTRTSTHLYVENVFQENGFHEADDFEEDDIEHMFIEHPPKSDIGKISFKKVTLPSAPGSKRKKRKCKNIDMVQNAISSLKNITPCNYDAIKEDELHYFGKYVTAQLRKMSAVTALRAQEQIQGIITQERIASLSPEYSGQSPLSPSSSAYSASAMNFLENSDNSKIFQVNVQGIEDSDC